MNVFVKYRHEIRLAQKCDDCRSFGWSSKTVPVRDRAGKWHHPSCKQAGLPLPEARTLYGAFALLERDGQPLAVIRPQTPELVQRALALTQEARRNNDAALFNDIPALISDYVFMGFLPVPRQGVVRSYIVDRDGLITGELEPGDSFVPLDQITSQPK